MEMINLLLDKLYTLSMPLIVLIITLKHKSHKVKIILFLIYGHLNSYFSSYRFEMLLLRGGFIWVPSVLNSLVR